MDTERALEVFAESINRFPNDRTSLASAAVETARWIKTHSPSKELVERWMNEARALDSRVSAEVI